MNKFASKLLSVNQMLFFSHLFLVMVIIIGMSFSRYESEWNTRVESAGLIAQQSLSSMINDISLSVAGRNYTKLTMPSQLNHLQGIENLLFMEIRGQSDYSGLPVGVRFSHDEDIIWRTDVSAEDIIRAKQTLHGLSQSLVDSSGDKRVKLQYLFNKSSEDLRMLERSMVLKNETRFEVRLASDDDHPFVLVPKTQSLQIHIPLVNKSGGSLFAVFDASALYQLRSDIVRSLAVEAVVAILVSILIILSVTYWIVKPIRRMASYMSQDIEKMNFSTLPELDRRDEIGSLARMLKMLAEKVQAQLKELRHKSDTDALTGLGGRHSYNTSAEVFYRHTMASKRYFGLIICDIDNFKLFNDNFGHSRGDEVLKIVADAINSALLGDELAFRIGGEEFVVMASCCHCDEVHRLAERVRNHVANRNLPHARQMGTVTISVGAVCVSPGQSVSYREVFEQADSLLYDAKTAGKNRIRLCRFSDRNNDPSALFEMPICKEFASRK
ncbi:hypothetical protein CS022_12005 [Veronia nyctiphanis]|uniref:diguanylate cyclase n=1 Tax=Veronia nyctiphanis TaxID=1278244 RepID=A0A4Q0YSB8_9GAMM|nr:GGDEF domain-containing protein [Veronia nyctiphanis]RXJ73014.1 hypothetical protein CS022_12005 [Veronia nyctiphanis]